MFVAVAYKTCSNFLESISFRRPNTVCNNSRIEDRLNKTQMLIIAMSSYRVPKSVGDIRQFWAHRQSSLPVVVFDWQGVTSAEPAIFPIKKKKNVVQGGIYRAAFAMLCG